MRTLSIAALALWGGFCVAEATTLQRLTLDDMIQQSTAIVRGKVQMAQASMQGRSIYTHYTVQVVETLKGSAASQVDIVVPGGSIKGFRQIVAGSPSLLNGQEYVLFLWTSRTGLTHIIGMSQGLFVSSNGMLSRPMITEHMIDANGAEASDPGMRLTLAALRSRIAALLNGKTGSS